MWLPTRLSSLYQLRIMLLLLLLFLCRSLANDEVPTEVPPEPGPPVIMEHPLDTIIPRGEPVTLSCRARGNPAPKYKWYKDGEVVSVAHVESSSHRVLLPNGGLFFLRVHSGKSAKTPDSGVYWCVVSNRFGSVRSRNASLKIAMLRDDFRTRPSNVQAVVGQQAMLECAPPRGFPEPVVFWLKDDQELRAEDDERLNIHSSGNLIITEVRQQDSGFYTCVARNMVSEKRSNQARLSVYEKPRFVQKPDDKTAEVGTNLVFACKVSGDPMPVIVWRKKEGKMPLGRAQILESKGLRIDRVISSDEGEYVCEARNPAGEIEASARLTVHAAPTFSREPQDVTAQEGETALFHCEAIGNPPPTKFWSREGSQEIMFPGFVSKDGRIKVDTSGNLEITGVKIGDQGFFVCSAINGAGSNIAKGYLKVAGRTLLTQPPPIITQGPVNQTLPVQTVAILPCRAVGHTPPTIAWTRNGRQLSTSNGRQTSEADTDNQRDRYEQLSTGTLEIRNLEKDDTGMYTCVARNADGETRWSAYLSVKAHTNPDAVFHRMSEPQTFPSAPSKPRIINSTHTAVQLAWKPPNRQGASALKGYLLQYFSPEKGQEWVEVPGHVREPRFTVSNLQPGSSYIFLVRAENDNGIGEPSAMSNIVRTQGEAGVSNDDLNIQLARKRLGAEQLVKLLEVKPINATAVKLIWRTTRVEQLIQGFYIKWKGPTAGAHPSWINVTSAMITQFVVSRLKPYTTYNFFVTPYYRMVEGVPSNSLDGTTHEAVPSAPPRDVKVRMMNMTTLRISWRLPPPEGINGILKGFQIRLVGYPKEIIDTHERASSVTIYKMVPGKTYTISVAAKTGAGVGVYNEKEVVTMNKQTLQRHLTMDKTYDTHARIREIVQTPWFIAIVGVVIWILLFALVAGIWYYRKKGAFRKKQYLTQPFIKINDGSVLTTARDALWMDHSAYNTAQRNLLLNGANGAAPGVAVQQHNANAMIFNDLRVDTEPSVYYAGANPELVRAALARQHSPNGNPYDRLGSQHNLSTFYQTMGSPRGRGESPTPYATTTLVMGAHRQNLLNEALMRGHTGTLPPPHVQPPSCPPPSAPPLNFQQAPGSARGESNKSSDSPPHTDVSYVHSSSDGTGSSNGGGGVNTGRRGGGAPGSKPSILDFIPPPPAGPPPGSPPENYSGNEHVGSYPQADGRRPARSAPLKRRGEGPPVAGGSGEEYDYDALNEILRSFHSSSPLDHADGSPAPRHYTHGDRRGQNPPQPPVRGVAPPFQYCDAPSSAHDSSPGGSRESVSDVEYDRALRTSNNAIDDYSSQQEEADDDAIDGRFLQPDFREALASRGLIREQNASRSRDLYGTGGGGTQRRPQPCMGVSASELSQSTYEHYPPRGNNSASKLMTPPSHSPAALSPGNQRLRSLPKQPPRGGKKDFV